jgi:multidrug efflux pump subunit AcrA (membrane-fusion protein)
MFSGATHRLTNCQQAIKTSLLCIPLCLQETQPSHFTKGTYDFWGHTQARLMDGLVVLKDSPEAAAAAEAMAAAEAAAAAAAAGDEAPAAAPAAAAAAATPADAQQQQQPEAAAKEEASGQQQESEQQQKAAEAEAEEPPHDPAHKATHVLIVRDPAGRILTVPYEHGKNHKTHGPNRKLWVIKLMEQLGLHQGDLLVATKEPFMFKPLAVRQQEAALMQQQHLQPDGPWKKVLDRWVGV